MPDGKGTYGKNAADRQRKNLQKNLRRSNKNVKISPYKEVNYEKFIFNFNWLICNFMCNC